MRGDGAGVQVRSYPMRLLPVSVSLEGAANPHAERPLLTVLRASGDARWQGGALGALEGHHPSGGGQCQSFRLSIAHDPHMAGHYWLADVCQQAIDIMAGKVGSSSFSASNLVLRADKYSDVGACL